MSDNNLSAICLLHHPSPTRLHSSFHSRTSHFRPWKEIDTIVTNIPAHTGHEEQHVEIVVHTAKQAILYQNLFQQLNEVADINPGSVLMDFEATIRKAVRCLALPLQAGPVDVLPEVRPGPRILDTCLSRPASPQTNHPCAHRGFHHLLRKHLDGNLCEATTFNTWSWNHHDTVLRGLPRSSNYAEGWHNRFKTLMSCTIQPDYVEVSRLFIYFYINYSYVNKSNKGNKTYMRNDI